MFFPRELSCSQRMQQGRASCEHLTKVGLENEVLRLAQNKEIRNKWYETLSLQL